MKMKLKPPPGHKLVRDWEGKRVRFVETVRNGAYEIPAGTLATVENAVGGTGLHLIRDPCPCCKVRVFITGIGADDVEVVAQES